MNIFSMVVTFENLHEVRRLCHWGPIIALSVISICSTMAILDSIIWYWPLDTTGGSINFIMLINWTVLILYNYFNAMFVGPGYIPLDWKPVRTFVRMNVWRTWCCLYLKTCISIKYKLYDIFDLFVSINQGNQHYTQYLQYCKVCQGFKAPRSHHCRKCNR